MKQRPQNIQSGLQKLEMDCALLAANMAHEIQIPFAGGRIDMFRRSDGGG